MHNPSVFWRRFVSQLTHMVLK